MIAMYYILLHLAIIHEVLGKASILQVTVKNSSVEINIVPKHQNAQNTGDNTKHS